MKRQPSSTEPRNLQIAPSWGAAAAADPGSISDAVLAERFRLLLETTRAIPWEADAQTWQFTYVGPQAVECLGFPLEQWYESDFWPKHIHPDDRQTAIEYCETSSSRLRDYEFEYRMIKADGQVIWIHDLVSVVAENGVPRHLRGFMIDITERKQAEEALRAGEMALRRSHRDITELAGRLISAQEDERRRLARELHDDFSQRLAALAIESDSLEQELPPELDTVRSRLLTIRDHVVRLAQDIHGMSRQLHPSILDDLGLLEAVESECEGFTERGEVEVHFETEDVPHELPRSVALCLYRVTQESLRNVAKHSQANRATVSLAGVGGGALLRVKDSGVGFDSSVVDRRGGLGLASMEERVRLLHGRLSIESRPGHGCLVEAWLPQTEPLGISAPAVESPIEASAAATPAGRSDPL